MQDMYRQMGDKAQRAYGGGDASQQGYKNGGNPNGMDWAELGNKMGSMSGVDQKEIKEKSKENVGKQFPEDEKKEKQVMKPEP